MCLLSLEAWSLLFIDAARVAAQIDTISPQMGLQTRRLQIEVRICRGLWRFSRHELPERLRSFVISSFKVHLQVDLWWSTGSLWVIGVRVMRKCTRTRTSRLDEMDCVTTSQLSEPHAFPVIPHVSHSPLRSPLWLHVVSAVSNKEEILVPSWPAHRGHRKIYGVCLLHTGCFWPEPHINNTSPVHHSSIDSSFMLWSSDFVEFRMWLHAYVFTQWSQDITTYSCTILHSAWRICLSCIIELVV